MQKRVELKDIKVRFDRTEVLQDITFSVRHGDIACLLGPSGCGKTTLLRTIAGFEQPAQGEVWLYGEKAADATTNQPVEQRQVGMVFQDYALFPHLSVRDNILFGVQKLSKSEQSKRLRQLSEMLAITDLLEHFPHQLSGGQQQRVAIARAMAPSPKILLLDEPFASMDVELREQLAKDIRGVLKETGMTTVMVSHNQLEAFALADVIGVLQAGRLLQWDSAFNLYHKPATQYVADFVGEGAFLPGTVLNETDVETELGIITGTSQHGHGAGELVQVLIRPDDIIHDDSSNLTAVVVDKFFRGAEFLYTLSLESGGRVLSLVPSHHDHPIHQPIGIRLEIDHLVVFGNAKLSQGITP